MSTARLLDIKNQALTQYTHRGVDTGVAGGGVRTTELLFPDLEMQKSEFVLPPPTHTQNTHRMASLSQSPCVGGRRSDGNVRDTGQGLVQLCQGGITSQQLNLIRKKVIQATN